MKTFLSVTSLLLLALLVAACGTSLNVRTNEQGNAVVELGLPESVVNTILRDSVITDNTDDNLLTEISSVDMKPGLITVVGSRTLPDGTKAPGSFDLSLTAENGALRASVSNVEIQGYTFTDEQLARLNERIASSLAQSASENANSYIDSVNISDDSLKFVVTIQNQQ
jgi:hypothetical protein